MSKKYKKCGNVLVVALSGYIVDNDTGRLYERYCADDFDLTSPRDIEEALTLAAGGEILLNIDSPGGDLLAGATIYTALMSYPGKVTVDIRSMAGSAASLIAMVAAKEGNICRMSPMALMFIHNVQGGADGDYRALAATAEMLKTANKTAIAAYQLKSGMEDAAIMEMMDNETYLSAEEALALGLVDEILFTEQQGDAVPDTIRGLANALTRSTGRMMNLLTKLPPPLPQNNADNAQDGAITKAQAMLKIEQTRY